jgi:hypothetical protein
MRKLLGRLMFSFLLIGIGSALFFFEVTEFRYDDGVGLSIGGNMEVVSNTYSLDNIDQVDANGAIIVIDDAQVGIKVDIEYNADITEVRGRTYTIITDCSLNRTTLCETTQKDKVTTLVVSYDHLESRFNPKALMDILIDQAKDKVILNVFNLTIPTVTITVSSENLQKVN